MLCNLFPPGRPGGGWLILDKILVSQFANSLAKALVSFDRHYFPLIIITEAINRRSKVKVRLSHHWPLCVGAFWVLCVLFEFLYSYLVNVILCKLPALAVLIFSVFA